VVVIGPVELKAGASLPGHGVGHLGQNVLHHSELVLVELGVSTTLLRGLVNVPLLGLFVLVPRPLKPGTLVSNRQPVPIPDAVWC
jgi:hypothetical protein